MANLAAPTGADNDGCEASVHYEIRIQGLLDQRWSSWFDGLTVANEPNSLTTVIAGPVDDQAALHGMLAKIRDLGLPLVSVRRIDPAMPGRTGRRSDRADRPRPRRGLVRRRPLPGLRP